MTGSLPVQSLGVLVRIDHIRGAGVSRHLGMAIRVGGVLAGKGMGGLGVAVGPAFLQIEMPACLTEPGTPRPGAELEMVRGAGSVALGEQTANQIAHSLLRVHRRSPDDGLRSIF
jgi:hypothetical protein